MQKTTSDPRSALFHAIALIHADEDASQGLLKRAQEEQLDLHLLFVSAATGRDYHELVSAWEGSDHVAITSRRVAKSVAFMFSTNIRLAPVSISYKQAKDLWTQWVSTYPMLAAHYAGMCLEPACIETAHAATSNAPGIWPGDLCDGPDGDDFCYECIHIIDAIDGYEHDRFFHQNLHTANAVGQPCRQYKFNWGSRPLTNLDVGSTEMKNALAIADYAGAERRVMMATHIPPQPWRNYTGRTNYSRPIMQFIPACGSAPDAHGPRIDEERKRVRNEQHGK